MPSWFIGGYKMLENAAYAGKMDSVDERNAINYSSTFK